MIRLLVLAFAPFAPVRRALTIEVVGCLLALVVPCSAVAHVLYYRLIANVGPAKALTVTFLVPAFGSLWGVRSL